MGVGLRKDCACCWRHPHWWEEGSGMGGVRLGPGCNRKF